MKLTGKHVAIGGAVAAVIAIATPFTGGFEGLVMHVYPDPVSHGAPWTYCYGETANPQFGHTYTKAECDATLATSLGNYDAGVRACTHVALPIKVEAAFLDAAYNLGTGFYCRNVAPVANTGHLDAACRLLPHYDHAGGRVIHGLTVRRDAEQALCLEGVAEGLPK
ncbi:MAG: lysozyme [Devosia sp.]|nr:lysozyme [Devosia sp.]